MLVGEEPARLAQAGGNFVEDQKRSGAVAGLADGLPEPRRGHQRGGTHGFRDEGSEIAFPGKHVGDHAGAGTCRLFEAVVAVGTVAARPRCDVLRPGHQRSGDMGTERRLAANARGAKARTMKGIPEGQRLEAPGRGPRDLERDLDRIGTTSREQDLRQVTGRQLAERLGEFHRRLVREPPRREGQIVELLFDRRDKPRMPVAEMVDTVAMEIHVAAAGEILDPDAFGPRDRRNAGARKALVKESLRVAIEKLLRRCVRLACVPFLAGRAGIRFALCMNDAHAHSVSRNGVGGRHGCVMHSHQGNEKVLMLVKLFIASITPSL